MMSESPELLTFMHRASKLTREEIWDGDTVYYPSVREQFAKFPRLGFVGVDYKEGGWLFVGSNGNSTEGLGFEKAAAKYDVWDSEHMELMKRFRESGRSKDFHALNEFERKDILGWHLDWAVSGSLPRLSLCLDDIAVCNVIPFSTKDAPSENSVVWRNSMTKYFRDLTRILKPNGIVWLGKAAYTRSGRYMNKRPAELEAIVNRQQNLTRVKQFADLDRLVESI